MQEQHLISCQTLEFGHLPATRPTPRGLLDTCQDVGLNTSIKFRCNHFLQFFKCDCIPWCLYCACFFVKDSQISHYLEMIQVQFLIDQQ